MGRYFMPTKETAEEFETEAKGRGYETQIEPDEAGGYNVIVEGDEGYGTRDEFATTVADVVAEKSKAKNYAIENAQDLWDDALPDESPIGKSQAEIDEIESREQERLARKNEKRRKKYDIEDEEPRDIGKGVKSALGLLGVGKINKKALGMYGVGKPSTSRSSAPRVDDGYATLRELTRPQSIKTPSATKPAKKIEVLSPIARLSTGIQRKSPLEITAVGSDVMQESPLAYQATNVNIKTSRIGKISTSPLFANPASMDMSKIARIAKQSSIIKPPNEFAIKVNRLKRGL